MKKRGIGVMIFAILATSEIISKASNLPEWYERAWKEETKHIGELGDVELSSFYEQFKTLVGISSIDLKNAVSSRLADVLHSLDEYQNDKKDRLNDTVQLLSDVQLIDEFDQNLIKAEIELEYESMLLEVLTKNSDDE